MSTNNGGPAFPLATSGYGATPVNGMTLRDYFAAKAMQGAIAGMAARGETAIYRECSGLAYDMADAMLAEREKCGHEQHGIAPPDGRTPVAWAVDTPYGRAYSFAEEVLGKWSVEIDANGCSTHPKAPHGFARQASHSEGEYVCECAGFDPYDAGYQDGIWAAWDANGRLLPDGWVLVPRQLTTEMLLARNSHSWPSLMSDEVEALWDALLAAAPEAMEVRSDIS